MKAVVFEIGGGTGEGGAVLQAMALLLSCPESKNRQRVIDKTQTKVLLLIKAPNGPWVADGDPSGWIGMSAIRRLHARLVEDFSFVSDGDVVDISQCVTGRS